MKQLRAALALLASVTPTVSAQWIFDNGTAVVSNDDATITQSFSAQTVYSQFFLSAPTLITLIQYNAFWDRDTGGPQGLYTGNTLWSVWRDWNGTPGSRRAGGLTPGSWYFGGGTPDPSVGPDTYCGGRGVGYLCYQHDLAVRFVLSPGTYWLGLQNGATPPVWNYHLAPSATGVAFRLGGYQLAADATVPEPATITLVAAALVGIVASRHRRKSLG